MYPGIGAVPLLVGPADYVASKGVISPTCFGTLNVETSSEEVFCHICMQKKFQGFSVEELRLKWLALRLG